MFYDCNPINSFFLVISFFVIFLSLTGTTLGKTRTFSPCNQLVALGIRLICAKILLQMFEWASHLQAEELDEENKEELTGTRGAGTSSGISFLGDNEPPPVRRKKRSRMISGEGPLITRKWSSAIDRKLHASDVETDTDCESIPGDVQIPVKNHTVDVLVNDMLEFVSAGIESIIEDNVTSRFKAEQLASWNLLSRSRNYAHTNWKLNLVWILGVVYRYSVLLPLRFFVFLVALGVLFVCSLVIGCVPIEKIRVALNRYAMLTFFRILSRSAASLITYHDVQNRPKNGIVVANHTSPIDVMILSCDNCYSMIGQRHNGVLGLIQKAVSRCSHHIWFERTQAKDRSIVRKALHEHIEDPDKLPILIFPEGTCINNTSVMMFKKGSFEASSFIFCCNLMCFWVADVVYPIALKYDNRLGDAFWNSSEQGYFSYILSIMTSWALICDVWYLPPVSRKEEEDPVDFAKRVKRLIAQKGGLVDLEWDGNLKRSTVPDRLKDEQKELFFQYLARTTTICDYTPDEMEEIQRLSVSSIGDLPEPFD